MPKGIPNKRHTGEFKQPAVAYKLSCGAEGLYLERRGRGLTGKPPKLPQQAEEGLIAENQRLRAENDYLKSLHALVSERVQRETGHK